MGNRMGHRLWKQGKCVINVSVILRFFYDSAVITNSPRQQQSRHQEEQV